MMLSMGKYIFLETEEVKRICRFTDNDWMHMGDFKEMEEVENIRHMFRNTDVPDCFKSAKGGILTEEQFNWVKQHSKYKGELDFPLYKLMRNCDEECASHIWV